MIARVLIDGPAELIFDYSIPQHLRVLPGCRVRVPIRQKTSSATVLSVNPPPDQGDFVMREIISLVEPEPLITAELLKVAHWISVYYGTSVESVIRSILPQAVRTEDNSAKTQRIARLAQEILPADLQKLEKRAPKQHLILTLLLAAENKSLPTTDLGPHTAASIKSLVTKNLISISIEELRRDPEAAEQIIPSIPLTLNDQQQIAFTAIDKSLQSLRF